MRKSGAKKDKRVITLGDKLYIDIVKYDYKDLFKV